MLQHQFQAVLIYCDSLFKFALSPSYLSNQNTCPTSHRSLESISSSTFWRSIVTLQKWKWKIVMDLSHCRGQFWPVRSSAAGLCRLQSDFYGQFQQTVEKEPVCSWKGQTTTHKHNTQLRFCLTSKKPLDFLLPYNPKPYFKSVGLNLTS